MIQVYFDNIENIISQQITSSKKKAFVAVAWFTNHALFEDLICATKRNVELKVVILDDILNRNEFGLDFGLLAQYGADVRLANPKSGTMHNKFCVIDDKVITGSYNWTYHANKNHENIIIVDEPGVVDSYCEQFEKLFNEGTPISIPYEHLKWTDVKEGDFTENRRNILRDVMAKNDENKDIRRAKLISLNDAYKSGKPEELAKASSLPIEKHLRTITDVLTSCAHDFELKLWEENIIGKPKDNVDGHDKLSKWFFLPYEIVDGTKHREYIKGELKTYSSRHIFMAGGLNLYIYDKQFVEVIKRYDNDKRGYHWYKDIPDNLLCIEHAQMFFYKFPSPMYNTSQPRTWPNTTPREISAIDVFGIAKEVNGDKVVFYDGWNPEERGQKIQNKFFSK